MYYSSRDDKKIERYNLTKTREDDDITSDKATKPDLSTDNPQAR
jgi:hypothetical protein